MSPGCLLHHNLNEIITFWAPFQFQDRLYLQYVELNAFQNEFRELANKFKENEKIIQKLGIHGTTLAEVNEELDNLETVTKALSVDVYKAKKLAKTGETLMLGTLCTLYICNKMWKRNEEWTFDSQLNLGIPSCKGLLMHL